MPAHRKLPDIENLKALLDAFGTHRAVADYLSTLGEPVGREAVTMAIAKERLRTAQPPSRARHQRYLPWHVRVEHNGHYAPRMLRLYASRAEGNTLRPADEVKLDRWLARLAEQGVSISYDRERAFFPVGHGTPGYTFDGPTAVAKKAG